MCFGIVCGLFLAGAASAQMARVDLRDGWNIQSSAKVTAAGDEISTAGFQPRAWYPARVPAAVVATLVKNGVYPDPYFGMNLRAMPGVKYGIGMNFANMPMPEDSPFRVAWWYRTEFRIPPSMKGQTLWLNFDAINYRANCRCHRETSSR